MRFCLTILLLSQFISFTAVGMRWKGRRQSTNVQDLRIKITDFLALQNSTKPKDIQTYNFNMILLAIKDVAKPNSHFSRKDLMRNPLFKKYFSKLNADNKQKITRLVMRASGGTQEHILAENMPSFMESSSPDYINRFEFLKDLRCESNQNCDCDQYCFALLFTGNAKNIKLDFSKAFPSSSKQKQEISILPIPQKSPGKLPTYVPIPTQRPVN